MNIAIVIAGGVGQRMGQDIPKQFINVNDKPIIIYTLECFERHPNIQAIHVVCVDGWHDILRAYAKQFSITKLEAIVVGGETGMQSIRNGLESVASMHNPDDIVLIHDAIRPMLSEAIISDNIVKCEKYGNATTTIPCAEAMLYTEDKLSSSKTLSRDLIIRTQTPQTFYLHDILDTHRLAKEKGITNSTASCTLTIEVGKEVFFATGSDKNVKLTTPDDIDIFKALLNSSKSGWIK